MVTMNNIIADKESVYACLQEIADPEIPVLSIIDLGIVRNIQITDDELEVFITSTYTGCPAMDMIAADIRMKLSSLGFTKIKITSLISPIWTTDWMSEEGKRKLIEYGIAPPDKRFLIAKDGVDCPHCQSSNTRLISEFGSTACKALFQCNDCQEPFDYFKCH
ncbi:MAG: phenylacetate-CoA oxygenase subunit PaaJ [Chitinophagaceae bacterium]|nr:MAG: phenylacetate-CoA oxygenase subunit PaaJ [Chitinophagaceae bacterium]